MTVISWLSIHVSAGSMSWALPLIPLPQELQDSVGALSTARVLCPPERTVTLKRWRACSSNNRGPWLQDDISPSTSRATHGAGTLAITEQRHPERMLRRWWRGGESLCSGQRHSDHGQWLGGGRSLPLTLRGGREQLQTRCLPAVTLTFP